MIYKIIRKEFAMNKIMILEDAAVLTRGAGSDFQELYQYRDMDGDY